MNPDIANGIANPFLTNGIIGVVCVALAWISLKLWAKIERIEAEHKTELAAKDALIKELYDLRVKEAQVGYEVLKSNERSQVDFLAAVNRRTVS